MRKSAYEKLKDAKRSNQKQAAFGTDGGDGLEQFFEHLLGGKMNPTQKLFIYGNEFCKGYKGPAGCAKTSTLAASALGTALLVPGSRIFISRNNYNDLMDTTLAAIQQMVDKLPGDIIVERNKAPPMKWIIRPMVVTGSEETDFSHITFMGLGDGLGSIQATRWYVDEADEVEEQRAREILTRLRAPGDERDYCASFVFNPPSKTHWLYTACTGLDAQEVEVAKPWMSLYEPEPRENASNLPNGYYERMADTLPADMRARLVEGKWGSTFNGQPVYREFKEALHVRRNLPYLRGKTVFRFWDFGYNRPACVFVQVSPFGHLRALREVIGHMEEAKKFARKVKAIGNEHFPNAEFMDFGDPAVNQHKDTGKTLYALMEEGITMYYRTSKIMEGVDLIRRRLEMLIDGEAALQFDEKHCPVLIDAFKGGYRLDRKLGEKPLKDGFYEHVADAYRYGVLNTLGGGYTTHNFKDLPDSLEYDAARDI